MHEKGGPHVAAAQSIAITWTRASRCGNGACVEVAAIEDRVLVRDSKVSDGPHLNFSQAAWRAFTAAVSADSLAVD